MVYLAYENCYLAGVFASPILAMAYFKAKYSPDDKLIWNDEVENLWYLNHIIGEFRIEAHQVQR